MKSQNNLLVFGLTLGISMSAYAAPSQEATYIESQKKIFQMTQSGTPEATLNVNYYVEMKTRLADLQEVYQKTPRWKFTRRADLEKEMTNTQDKIAESEKELLNSRQKEIVAVMKLKEAALAELLQTQPDAAVAKTIIEKVPQSDESFMTFVSKGLEDDLQRLNVKSKK